MRFRSCRRFIAVATAALFMLGAAGQHWIASGMAADAGMTMPVAASEVAADDNAMHCPPSDCSTDADKRMACFTHCTTVLGILSTPALVPVAVTARELKSPVALPLASLHSPPEPHPPKPFILT